MITTARPTNPPRARSFASAVVREEIFALVLSVRTFIALKQFSCLLVLTIIRNKQTQHDCFLKVVFFWFKLNFLSVAAGTNFVNIHAIFK